MSFLEFVKFFDSLLNKFKKCTLRGISAIQRCFFENL